jgi:hypothetical protein
MSMINITNVINISVMVPPAGLANYAQNNLVCFTKDTPVTPLTTTYAAYTSATDVATKWGSTSATYLAAVAVFSQSPNILTGGGVFIVIPMLTGEVLEQAIVRAKGLVYFGGCSAAYTLGSSGPTGYTGATGANLELIRSAAVAQSETKLLFCASSTSGDLASSALFDDIADLGQSYTRCLYHSDAAQLEAFKWGYAGRAMSTNFAGSNTTSTMNLKQIVGVTADDGLDQTTLNLAKACGADVYANIASRASILSSGINEFFDDIYNLSWFVGALQVAGFNYLATTSTKIPQTEAGMDGLKGAYRTICDQAITNSFIAKGEWTSPDTFGNPVDFKRNIGDFGYYIYSLPVATQSAADRADRKAPAISIAVKYAGAIHSSEVLVYINQ